LNNLLANSGEGYVLQLCPQQSYLIQAPIAFASPNQEISTQGYPTDNTRATLLVSGPIFSNGSGHTTAVDGTCATCSGVTLRNIQIDGARGDAPTPLGGANIEMGGSNENQAIQFVHSFNPRSWSCLHVTEGALACNNVLVQNNDIGPCGTDKFQQWADGISISCQNTIVRNNLVQGPTDGGIVLFGSPGSQVYNNTIWILNNTLLGGINMVDYEPWLGNYTGTIVHNNTILGGYANEDLSDSSKGLNAEDAIIKIGIAIGPRTWFGNEYKNNVSRNGIVLNNLFSGAFSYGIAITSATNFTVQGNSFFGNSSFIGARGPNCSATDSVPPPAQFIIQANTTSSINLSSNFVNISDGDGLTCVLPPNGGDFWPFGLNPSNFSSPSSPSSSSNSTNSPNSTNPSNPTTPATNKHVSSHRGDIAAGVIAGLILCGLATWLIRRCVVQRKARQHFTPF
jgi:parallel beta-helix repeat protein